MGYAHLSIGHGTYTCRRVTVANARRIRQLDEELQELEVRRRELQKARQAYFDLLDGLQEGKVQLRGEALKDLGQIPVYQERFARAVLRLKGHWRNRWENAVLRVRLPPELERGRDLFEVLVLEEVIRANALARALLVL